MAKIEEKNLTFNLSQKMCHKICHNKFSLNLSQKNTSQKKKLKNYEINKKYEIKAIGAFTSIRATEGTMAIGAICTIKTIREISGEPKQLEQPVQYGFNTRYHVTIPGFLSYKIILNYYILNVKGFLNRIIGWRFTAVLDWRIHPTSPFEVYF